MSTLQIIGAIAIGLVCIAVLFAVSLCRAAAIGDKQRETAHDFHLWQLQLDGDDAAMRDVQAHFERLDEEFGR